MIWLPEEPLPERLDFDEIFQKMSELRQQGKKIVVTELPKGRLEVVGDYFKLVFSPYGKVQVCWDDAHRYPAVHEACKVLMTCLKLELHYFMLVEPDYIKGAKCRKDLGYHRGKVFTCM